MKKILALTTVAFFAFSCGQAGPPKTNSDSLKAGETDEELQLSAVKNYYTWYNDHFKEMNQFNLVKNCPNNGDTTLIYRVDFEGAKKWMLLLKSSGQVSENYISDWEKYFMQADKDFIAAPTWDGPPAGFDYDLIWNSQEDGPTNAQLSKAILVKMGVKGNQTEVRLVVPGYYDTFKNRVEKNAVGKWVIAK